MRILNLKSITTVFIISALLLACKKEAGVGGKSSISGHITIRHYNANFNQFLGTYDGADQYVYIVYGNHNGYDQRLKTDYNGNFEFKYLYPGEYKIYSYSLDSTLQSLSGTVPVVQNVTLEKKENKVLPDMIIFN
jgi:hypothetical protein